MKYFNIIYIKIKNFCFSILKRVWKKGNTPTHTHTVGGSVNPAANIETVWSFLKNLKIEPSHNPAILLLGTYQININSKRHMYCNVHSSIT